jgi:hypothetical protein
MSTQISLKEIERKAFRSTFQDGLWDLYFGLVVICMSIFVYRPATGYSPVNIVMMLGACAAAYALFWAGKKFITLPRMGQVQFGAARRKRRSSMVIALSVLVAIQVLLVLLTLWAWANPEVGARLGRLVRDRNTMDLVVASLAALIIGPGMIMVAYSIDFPRGYFIAIMMALAGFLMVYLNQPIYPILIGAVIALPGLVLFVRFLQKYPVRREEAPHD